MIHHPWFELHLSVRDCRHELRCNGIPVTFDNQGLPAEVSFPVNHWLAGGDNTLELLLPDAPLDLPETAAARVELRLSAAGLEGGAVTVSRLSWRRDRLDIGDPLQGSSRPGGYQLEDILLPDPNGEFRVGAVASRELAPGRGLHLNQTVSFDTGLPTWAFHGAEALGIMAMDETQRDIIHVSLCSEISRLHRLLRQGRIEEVADLCEERNRELDQAFYRPAGETRGKLLAALADAVRDPAQSLAAVSPDILAMDPWPDDVLVRLVRSDFSPAIVWVWRDPPMSRAFDFVFRREAGRWVICR